MLSRLVALNQERAAEEKRGVVHWLRPDFQRPKLRHKVPQQAVMDQVEAELEQVAAEAQPKWPKDGMEQIRVVHDLLGAAGAPVSAEAVARAFDGKLTAKRRERVFSTLVTTGAARTPPENPSLYFVPR